MSKYPGRVVTDLAPAGYSVFFDGTGDYLVVDGGSLFAFGTGDFTVEFWYNSNNTGVQQIVYDSRPGVDGAYLVIYKQASNVFSIYVSGAARISGTVNIAANTWYHIAVCRSGTSTRLFVNGTQDGSTYSDSTSYLNTASRPVVGAGGAVTIGTDPLNGYMSNVRVIKGTALYTTAFTPPTQLFNITNTSLLTCNSPAIIDQSSNAVVITANGNAAVSTLTPFRAYVPYNPALGASTPGVWTVDEAMQAAATRQWNMYDPNFQNTTLLLHGNPTNGTSFITDASTNNFTVTPVGDTRAANLSPFSLTTFATSGSAYLDGAADYLTVASNAAFGYGTGNVTIEAWVYHTSRATNGTIYASDTDNLNIFIKTSGLLAYYNGSVVDTTFTVPLNTWTHVAFVRSGTGANQTKMYANGVEVLSTTNSINYANTAIRIGTNPGVAGDLFNGYISNVRIVKGVGVYTGNFTTPTAPLTAVQAAGTNISAITGTQTSLLTLQNSQSANNNAFLDSSSNNFLITRNGNTTQGSFSPFSQTGWSNYFDGTGDYLTVPNNAAFNLGTNDFTLELFWYPVTFQAGSLIEASSVSNYAFAIYAQASGAVQFYAGTGASASWNILSAIAMGTATLNAWNHIVVVRSGTTFSYYLNGTRTGQSTSVSSAIGQQGIGIGGNSSGASITGSGYISNIRLVNGAALYSGPTLTVPTAPLTTTSQGATASQVELLTCQSNRFIDNSDNTFPITRNGDTSVQAFSPFYPTAAYTPQTIGGSGYFDGNADSLSSATSFEASTSTSTFTIEGWIYPTTFSTLINIIGGMVVLSGDQKSIAAEVNTSGQVALYWFDGSIKRCTGNTVMQLNAWNYFAIVVNSNAISIYVNKTTADTLSGTTTLTNRTQSTTLGVGAYYNNNTPAQYFTGYLSGLRYSTVARTISAVPTSPLLSDANVRWLLNFTNAGVVDSTGKNALETVGNAQISTTQSKFGGSSMYFDGTGDYLSIRRSNLLLPVANQDFTFECWVYPTATPGAQGATIMGCGEYGTDDNWNVNINSSLQVSLYIWSANNSYTNTTRTVTVNAWNHIAVARSGTGTNNLKVFVNGIGQSFSVNNTLVGPTRNFSIGADENGDESVYTGYIDELRFTLGVGRYTADFTPQTSQWQDQ